MDAEQKLAKIREQNRLRAKKYYDANKGKVSDRRKEGRKEVVELKEAAKAADAEPVNRASEAPKTPAQAKIRSLL